MFGERSDELLRLLVAAGKHCDFDCPGFGEPYDAGASCTSGADDDHARSIHGHA